MQDDEQAIHHLVATWQSAGAAGDLSTLLNLMAEDVVFLVPGQPPMRGREAFATAFQLAVQQFHIASSSQIQEIQVFGDWAYCWNHLAVTMTPRGEGSAMRRSGYTLTILRKYPNDNWVLYRDANMLTMDRPATH